MSNSAPIQQDPGECLFIQCLLESSSTSFLVVLFTDSMCERQGALGNLNACLWKEVNQGELLR